MLFARLCSNIDYLSIREEITADMLRGYSFWAGEYDPKLTQDPGIRTFDEMAALMPEKEEDLASARLPPISRGGLLAGLCAACRAQSYSELAQRIWEDRANRKGWITGHKPIIAIFEGNYVGDDPDGWPLFSQGRVRAITKLNAIRRA